jgi:hypothetical protein
MDASRQQRKASCLWAIPLKDYTTLSNRQRLMILKKYVLIRTIKDKVVYCELFSNRCAAEEKMEELNKIMLLNSILRLIIIDAGR